MLVRPRQPAHRRTLAAALWLAAALAGAQAGQQAGVVAGPPATLVVLGDLSVGGSEQRIADILFQRVSELASGRGYDVRAEPTLVQSGSPGSAGGGGSVDLTDVRVSQLLVGAVPGDIELVVAVFYRVERTALLIQFALYDPARQTILGGVLTRARTGLTLFTTVERAVAEMAPILDQYLVTRAIQRPETDTVDSILVRGGQEDVLISFAGRDVGSVTGGELAVPYTPFSIGTRVRYDASKPGYHPVAGVAELDAAENLVSIEPLWRQNRLAVDVHWRFGQAIGLGVGTKVYFIPDVAFVALDQYRQLQPGNLGGGTGANIWHHDVALNVGLYPRLLPPDFPVRVTIGVGVGAVFTGIEGIDAPDFVDVYFNVLSPAVEWNLNQWRLFVRPELQFALGVGSGLLGRTWVRTPFGLPPISVGVARQW